MKIFGKEYETVQPKKGGCDLVLDMSKTGKTIDEVKIRIVECRAAIEELEKEINFLSGILIATEVM